jgi:hypothetical protein
MTHQHMPDQPGARELALPPAAAGTTPALPLESGVTPQLDVAALMQEALDAQEPGEEIDAALRRTLQGKDLQGVDMICQVIGDCLRMQEWRLGVSRLQAAQQLARAQTRLMITPDGKPYLESFVTNVSGLESVPPHLRDQVLEQVNEQLKRSLAGEKVGPVVLRLGSLSLKASRLPLLILGAVAVLVLAYLAGVFD